MRLQSPAWFLSGVTLLLSLGGAASQGTFQNLGFESASLVPISANRVQFAPAFPGWTGSIGGVQQTGALYNDITLDTSAISIIDHSWSNPFGGPGGIMEGNFTAILIAGLTSLPYGNQPVDVTLAQTGVVPVGTESLQFRAYALYSYPFDPFAVTLGGQTLSLIPLESGPNYTLYGADIRALAGQSAELDFTLFAQRPHMGNNYLYLDSIQFCAEAVPEPSVFGLSALGALLLGWRALARRRRS